MAFRHHSFISVVFSPQPVEVEKQVTNFDKNGVEHVSFVSVSAQTITDSLPRPSEFTILSQMQSGSFKPVPLDDFEISNVDAAAASQVINSLNVNDNENI